MMRTTRGKLALRIVCLIGIATVVIFPLYWMLLTAIRPTSALLSANPRLWPDSAPSIEGFTSLFDGTIPLTVWLTNSAIITIGSTVVATVASVLAGYSLSRFGGKGHQAMGLAMLLARMIPGTLLVIPLYVVFLQVGLVNNVWSLIAVNTTFIVPFTTWMLKAFFDGIPPELEEAAYVDGASRLRTLWSVILPLSGPGIVAAITYSAVLSWGDFLYARTLLTADANWPITQGLASFFGDNATQWNSIMAVGLVAIIPMLLLFLFTERYLTSGLTSGAVKG